MTNRSNSPRTIAERMARIETIEKLYGVTNLTGVIEQLTVNRDIPVEELSVEMKSAIIAVLEMENPHIRRTVTVNDALREQLERRRAKLGITGDDWMEGENEWADG
jgi:hypothetical protein